MIGKIIQVFCIAVVVGLFGLNPVVAGVSLNQLNCPDHEGLSEQDFDYSKTIFYNTADWQPYRAAIKFVSVGPFVNYLYCKTFGESFNLETMDEFDPDDCELISYLWFPASEMEVLNNAFESQLEKYLEGNEEGAIASETFDQVTTHMKYFAPILVNLAFLHGAYRANSPFYSKGGNRLTRSLIRGLGWLSLLTIGTSYLSELSEKKELDSEVRALDVNRLMRKNRQNHILSGEGEFNTDEILNTIRRSLEDALRHGLYHIDCLV